jgi:hypothetical protein
MSSQAKEGLSDGLKLFSKSMAMLGLGDPAVEKAVWALLSGNHRPLCDRDFILPK